MKVEIFFGIILAFLISKRGKTFTSSAKVGPLSLLAYFYWIYFDRNTPSNGGRPNKTLRNLYIFKLMRKYFPIEVVHDFDKNELDPSKTYLVALHPHGNPQKSNN